MTHINRIGLVLLIMGLNYGWILMFRVNISGGDPASSWETAMVVVDIIAGIIMTVVNWREDK